MNAANANPPAPTRPPFGAIAVLGVLLVLFLLGLGTIFYAVRVFGPFQAADDLPQAAALYRRMGLPWEAKDLARNPPLPESRNAAPLIERCTVVFTREKAYVVLAKANDRVKQGKFDAAEALVKPFNQQVDWAKDAARIGSLEFKHDWDMGPYVLFPHTTSLEDLSKMVCWRADDEAFHGRVDTAIQNLQTANVLSKMAGEDEGMIPMLVETATGAIECRAEETCAAQWCSNSAALRRLAAIQSRPRDDPDFSHALRGEAYIGIVICRNLKSFGPSTVNDSDAAHKSMASQDLRRTGFPADPMSRAFLDRCLRFWIETHRIVLADGSDSVRMASDMDALAVRYSQIHSLSDVMGSILTPVFTQAEIAGVKLRAMRLANRALVQALLIHAKTGAYPQSISEIPGKWIDPFSAKPLHLKLTEHGIRIYSVGPSGVDHGGVSQYEVPKEQGASQAYDILASYPPVTHG